MKNTIAPELGATRIYRQVTFDRQTFDALKDQHRALEAHHGRPLSNSEVLRVLVLAHAPRAS